MSTQNFSPLINLTSSTIDPYAANYMGRMEEGYSGAGTIPMTSMTNPYAANYAGVQEAGFLTPKSNGDVLGANTSNNNNNGDSGLPTNPQVNEFYNGYRWTGSGWAAPAGQGQGDLASQISDAYAPALDALNYANTVANEGAQTQEDSVLRNYDATSTKIGQESGQLTGDTQTRQTAFNKQLKSAYEQAIKLYNALKQQGISRFGGASSAGEFVTDLARQEMFKQQRDIGEQQSTGDMGFSKEFARIGEYVGNKKTDLDNWKNDAMGQIKQNLKDTLVSIAGRRGEIEANKTKDKIAALEAAKSRVQEIQNADIAFRQGLATTSISQAQEIAGRVFTPQEISARLAQWGISMGQTTEAPTSSSIYANVVGTKPKGTDQFGNLTY